MIKPGRLADGMQTTDLVEVVISGDEYVLLP
jgi:hypothetical protein